MRRATYHTFSGNRTTIHFVPSFRWKQNFIPYFYFVPSLNGTNTVLKRCVQLFRPCFHVFMNNFLYSGLNFRVLSYNLVHFSHKFERLLNSHSQTSFLPRASSSPVGTMEPNGWGFHLTIELFFQSGLKIDDPVPFLGMISSLLQSSWSSWTVP